MRFLTRRWSRRSSHATCPWARRERHAAVTAGGILAALYDDGIIGVNWTNCNAVGWIKLVVPAERAEEAAGILTIPSEDAPEGVEPDVVETPAEDAPTDDEALCPACGSANIARLPKLWIFVGIAVIGIVLGVATGVEGLAFAFIAAMALILAVVPSTRCRDCGEQWTPAAKPERAEPEAAPPEGRDLLEPHCPRCHSTDIYRIRHRPLEAATMLMQLMMILPLLFAIWPLLPKRHCDRCGLTLYL